MIHIQLLVGTFTMLQPDCSLPNFDQWFVAIYDIEFRHAYRQTWCEPKSCDVWEGRSEVARVCLIKDTPRDMIVECLVGWHASTQLSEINLK